MAPFSKSLSGRMFGPNYNSDNIVLSSYFHDYHCLLQQTLMRRFIHNNNKEQLLVTLKCRKRFETLTPSRGLRSGAAEFE